MLFFLISGSLWVVNKSGIHDYSNLVFQAATQPIGPTGYYISFLKLKLSIYTTPCLIMILLGLLNIALVLVNFRKVPNEKRIEQKQQLSCKFRKIFQNFSVFVKVYSCFYFQHLFSDFVVTNNNSL